MAATRIKILLAIVLSFLISSFIIRYSQTSESPYIDAAQIGIDAKNLVANFASNINPSKLVSFLTVPNLSFNKNYPTSVPHDGSQQYSIPSPKYTGPKPSSIIPTIKSPSPTKTVTPIKIPTAKPKATATPTKKPKPSATPKPQLPPITTALRPGSNLEDIYNDVQKRLCVPAALLKSIQLEETGTITANFVQGNFTFFNTYGWWNNSKVTQRDICGARAYSVQSGIVPYDSKFAGTSCNNAIQPDAYDQVIMGLLQVSQQEQDLSFKNTSKVITTGKIDRRVLYDNALIFASVTLNKVGNLAETGCGDWSFKAVVRAACKHLGVCNYNYGANNGNYCVKICNHYNEFAGTHYDCANASSLLVANGDDGKCTLK